MAPKKSWVNKLMLVQMGTVDTVYHVWRARRSDHDVDPRARVIFTNSTAAAAKRLFAGTVCILHRGVHCGITGDDRLGRNSFTASAAPDAQVCTREQREANEAHGGGQHQVEQQQQRCRAAAQLSRCTGSANCYNSPAHSRTYCFAVTSRPLGRVPLVAAAHSAREAK